MLEKQVTRYEKYPDSASYHRPPALLDSLRTSYFKLRYGFEIDWYSKICRHVEIKITKGGRLKIGHHTTIADYVFIQLTKPSPHVRIGNHTVIGRNSIIASKTDLTIGNYVLIGPYCQIIDSSHGMARADLIINQKAHSAPIVIKDDVWLGTGVRVLPGVTIGAGSIIGANSVVTKTIPDYEIWAGNPARFLRKRE